MATLTIEIPDSLQTELDQRQIPPTVVDSVVVQTLETWLQISAQGKEQAKDKRRSSFVESAVPFVEQLMNDNLELFERLAKL
jgi:hypothetical protein